MSQRQIPIPENSKNGKRGKRGGSISRVRNGSSRRLVPSVSSRRSIKRKMSSSSIQDHDMSNIQFRDSSQILAKEEEKITKISKKNKPKNHQQIRRKKSISQLKTPVPQTLDYSPIGRSSKNSKISQKQNNQDIEVDSFILVEEDKENFCYGNLAVQHQKRVSYRNRGNSKNKKFS